MRTNGFDNRFDVCTIYLPQKKATRPDGFFKCIDLLFYYK